MKELLYCFVSKIVFTLYSEELYFLVNKLCGAGFIEYHLQIFKPLAISGSAGIFTFMIYHVVKTDIIVVNILIVSLLGLVSLYVLYSKFNVDFLETIKEMVRRNG